MSLKALAEAVLARNSQHHRCATEPEKARNFDPVFDNEKLRGLETAEAIREQLEERAAIREHDGGQTRPKAEQGAIEDVVRCYAYRYRLHSGEGSGTFISPATTLEEARAALLLVYGPRLALIAKVAE